jgi:hypothetical protein
MPVECCDICVGKAGNSVAIPAIVVEVLFFLTKVEPIKISRDGVYKLIKNINPSKATGPDTIAVLQSPLLLNLFVYFCHCFVIIHVLKKLFVTHMILHENVKKKLQKLKITLHVNFTVC